ncbi:ATP-binding protein [Actinoplanes derwentensis]|uniref:AAA ATPase domain-containing protein n=1 Tax=Actinoplanes derwentensis TaxID=113562 RepID=A0A1H1R9B1_9ACTN|nr:ATP-binding protein [Actinoplanes derwentensis]GID88048.1 hypothetical protein Ade03nite_69720 [Actinoplanes derwentensis]SDS32288.1 hypothetical protein SAMN04489716_0529 [Actinoplanes derwentensis]
MTGVGVTSTTFLSELGPSGDTIECERVQEIVFGHGGAGIGDGPVPGRRGPRIEADFASAYDAARAAVAVVTAAAGRHSREAPRIVLSGPEPGRRVPADRWLPARVLEIADPGQIIVTAPTAVVVGPGLPGSTVLVHRGHLPAGDGRGTQRLYELRLAADDRQANLDWARRAVDGTSIALDLSGLTATWRQAAAGDARLILLSGPRESHRDAVAAELALRLHSAGAQVLYGSWHPEAHALGGAFLEALGVYADGCDTERLRAELQGCAGAVSGLLPDVAARLGRRRDHSEMSPVVQAGDVVEHWIRAISCRRPTLLVLDDAHLAGTAGLQQLCDVWYACRRSPLMVLVSAMDEGRDRGSVVDRVIGLAVATEPKAFSHIRL